MSSRSSPIEAREALADALPQGPECTQAPLDAVGQVLSRDVRLPRSIPGHPLGAMDGFAVREADVPGTVTPVGRSAPGDEAPQRLEPGTACRTLTGAPVPANADHVVPIENVREKVEAVHVPSQPTRSNIVPEGEAVQAGVTVPAGTRIDPGLAETLATQGIDPVHVRALPRIKIVPLGDELVEGKVIDTVAPLLEHLLAGDPGSVERSPPRPDDEDVLDELMNDPAPVVVTTGGTGPSEKDQAYHYSPDKRLFDGVNVKPGKPVQASRREEGGAWVALPGNPTSALFTFQAIVLTALRRQLTPSGDAAAEPVPHRVAQPIDGHPKKWKIVPVRVSRQGVVPVGDGPSLATGWWRGSDGVVLLQPATSLEEGSRTEVRVW